MRLKCKNCSIPIKQNNKFFLSKMPINNELYSNYVVKKNYSYNFLNCNFCNLIQLHSTNKNFLNITNRNKEPNNENSNHQEKIFNDIKKKINIKKIKKILLVSQYDSGYINLFDKKIKIVQLNNILFKKNSKIKYRQEHVQRKITHCNIENFFFEKFDLIIMSKLLEHSEQPNRIITNLAKLLSYKGKILIDVPDTENCLNSVNISTIWEDHLYYFNKYSLRSLLDALSFKTLFIKKYKRIQESDLYGLFQISNGKVKKNLILKKYNNQIFLKFKNNFKKKIDLINKKLLSFDKEIFFLGCGHNLLIFLRICKINSKIINIIDDGKNKIGKWPLNIKSKIIKSDIIASLNLPIVIVATPPEIDEKIKNNILRINSKCLFFSIFPKSKFYICK
jgi:2-polyprenyl-3-methyl-5-hydroxy-6-metoxy-1,4-benzoquinol methylase